MYQALYRKYRSRTFSEMAGQEAVIRTLRNQVIPKGDVLRSARIQCPIEIYQDQSEKDLADDAQPSVFTVFPVLLKDSPAHSVITFRASYTWAG